MRRGEHCHDLRIDAFATGAQLFEMLREVVHDVVDIEYKSRQAERRDIPDVRAQPVRHGGEFGPRPLTQVGKLAERVDQFDVGLVDTCFTLFDREATTNVDEMSVPDAGDETQRRFRYQINYAALKTLQILRSRSDVAAVYCEHLEDVLIEHVDGMLTGIQVKSRELNQKPFKSSDDSVKGSLARFCVRDARYPGRFKGFVLATNFVFFSGHGVDDLRNILKRCRENPNHTGVGSRDKIIAYLKGLAERTNVPIEDVKRTLAMVAHSPSKVELCASFAVKLFNSLELQQRESGTGRQRREPDGRGVTQPQPFWLPRLKGRWAIVVPCPAPPPAFD